jgi:hypothetical protein
MILLLLTACSGGPGDSGETAAPLDPTLTNVQAHVFDASCAFSSCHGGSYGSGDLDLTAGASYGELVGVESTVPGEILVVAGDSASSYLVKKCTAGATFEGTVMPDGSPDGLDAERLDLLEAWIDAGAADD